MGQPVVLYSPVGQWEFGLATLVPMAEYHRKALGLAPRLNPTHLAAHVAEIARDANALAARYYLRSADGQVWRGDIQRTAANLEAATRLDERIASLHRGASDEQSATRGAQRR